MVRVVVVAALMMALVAGGARAQSGPGLATAMAALNESAVMISMTGDTTAGEHAAPRWFGTGFVVGGGRLLVTNYHVAGQKVVDDITRLQRGELAVRCATRKGDLVVDGRQTDAWYQDLSLLDVGAAPVRGLSTARTFASLRTGERVYTLGNPGGMPWTLSTGAIAEVIGQPDDSVSERRLLDSIEDRLRKDGGRYRRHRYDRMVLVGPGFARPGNSGGAVVDDEGRLVGIVFALILATDGSERSLVIPADYLPMMHNGVRLAFVGGDGAPAPPLPPGPSTVPVRVHAEPTPGPPNETYRLVRHRPLDATSRERIAALLARENPGDPALCESLLARTREIWLHQDYLIEARSATVRGEATELAVWNEGNHPAVARPGALAWFFTRVGGAHRCFVTIPGAAPQDAQMTLKLADGATIAVWPETEGAAAVAN